MAEENDVIFREVQRFSLWLRLMPAFTAIVAIGIIGFLIIFQQFYIHPGVIALTILAVICPVILLCVMKLETEVRSDGLYVRFFPVHIRYKKFTSEDLLESHARTYRPIAEYGGWGIKWGKAGKAYNMSGKEGVQLVFKNGKRLLIGSQKSGELVKAIGSIMGNSY